MDASLEQHYLYVSCFDRGLIDYIQIQFQSLKNQKGQNTTCLFISCILKYMYINLKAITRDREDC